MPLTSANRVYKNFPNVFAENVNDHVKRRAESYRRFRNPQDLVLQNLDDDEISEACDCEKKGDEPAASSMGTSSQSHSRLTPEMRMLRPWRSPPQAHGILDSESETSSAATTPSTTPRSRTSPSPRGYPVNIIESPRPLNGGSFVPAFTVNTRKPRTSPRTTCSLDNVDLWEESDSETESQNSYDIIDGVSINPSKTFDLSDLRRSRSPVACKRNKLVDDAPVKKDRSKSRSTERRESRSATKSRARVNRRLKAMFVNTRASKAPQTIHESSENDENWAQRCSNDSSDKGKLLSNRGSRIAATFSNLRSKSDVFETKTDISKLSKSPKSTFSSTNNGHATYSAKPEKTLPCDISPPAGSINKSYTLNDMTSTISSTVKDGKPQSNSTKPEHYALHKLRQKPGRNSPDGSPSGGRRVKFNSFVTVREDELNTLEFLKKSTDTARAFKNRYLSVGDIDMGDANSFAQTIH